MPRRNQPRSGALPIEPHHHHHHLPPSRRRNSTHKRVLVNKFRWLWRHCARARGGALTAAAAMRARAPESALNRAFTFGAHKVTVKLRVWLRPSPALQISAALSQAGLPISSNSSILPRRLSCGHAIPQLLARQKTNIRLVIMNLITFIMTLIHIDTSIINKKRSHN
jgi:hypothetical protein